MNCLVELGFVIICKRYKEKKIDELCFKIPRASITLIRILLNGVPGRWLRN